MSSALKKNNQHLFILMQIKMYKKTKSAETINKKDTKQRFKSIIQLKHNQENNKKIIILNTKRQVLLV